MHCSRLRPARWPRRPPSLPVVVLSGDTGTGNYEYFASDMARLGYSTVLVDG